MISMHFLKGVPQNLKVGRIDCNVHIDVNLMCTNLLLHSDDYSEVHYGIGDEYLMHNFGMHLGPVK